MRLKPSWIIWAPIFCFASLGVYGFLNRPPGVNGNPQGETTEDDYAWVERILLPLSIPLLPKRPGDWLTTNQEPGQTFDEYLKADPVRRTGDLAKIYVLELGDFSPPQRKILDATYEYLEIFFATPVLVHQRLPLDAIPPEARRIHPTWGVPQVEVGHILQRVLLPGRPDDAMAYIAFTAQDLWPATGPGEMPYNFVFGQASLKDRVGAWSIARLGDPSKGEKERMLCLRRTLGTASHETGHILTIRHCTAFSCNMCGANSNEEGDRHPLHFCPVCLRKICWNLQLEPIGYMERLLEFCQRHGLEDEALYYRQALGVLKTK